MRDPRLALPIQGLWIARRKESFKSEATYWPVKRLDVYVQADSERRAKRAIIAFPLENLAYVIEDQSQLKGIINKLIGVYNQIQAKGQSRVVSFNAPRDGEQT